MPEPPRTTRCCTTSGWHVPLRWWALATMFLASVLVAFLVATPAVGGARRHRASWRPPWSRCSWATAPRASPSRDGVLRAGRARIPVVHLGECRPLDAAATRRLAGRDADARAFLLLRPYLRRAVRVDIADPGRPGAVLAGLAPRRPTRLVAALPRRRVRITPCGVGTTHRTPPRGGPMQNTEKENADGFGLEGLHRAGARRDVGATWRPARR